jgi:N-methylhydantoinase B
MISNCAETLRRELLPNIADGVYRWEDYVEFDGVERDHPPHAFRLKMTKTADKIHLDLNGTDPEAAGPINWPLDYAEGKFLRKFLAPVLRSMAASPERSAEIDINEGALDVLEVTFPEKGTLVTPTFGKPTGMRFFLFLRIMGAFAGVLAKATKGHIPADHETIRIWGMHGGKTAEDFYLFREVLGGGAPGRPWADGSDVVHIVPNSRNLPVEFSETRFPIRIEQLGLAQDSAGAGFRRGGFGYDKRVRSLNKSTMISNADRSELSCVGINGGKASDIYKASVERVDGTIQSVMGMSDNIVVEENEICRVITTGGGGWGDPLKREADLVAYDVTTGLVSTDAARNDYGVVVIKEGHIFLVDAAATKILRAKMSSNRDPLPLYDRGPGFEAFKKSGVIKYPTDWTDPDEGWLAFPSESYPK